MGVLKSPRPMEESNLQRVQRADLVSILLPAMCRGRQRPDSSRKRDGTGQAERCLGRVKDEEENGERSLGPAMFVVLLVGVVETSGVLDGHFVTLLGEVDPVTLPEDLASDSHSV